MSKAMSLERYTTKLSMSNCVAWSDWNGMESEE